MTRWLADTNAIAKMTGRSPATIRSWAHRGHLLRRGTGRPRGRGQPRALYDVEEAEELAKSMPALENRGTMCNTESSAGACPPTAPAGGRLMSQSYQATVYETALGSIRVGHGVPGPHVFIVGPQECTHHLTAEEAREAAEALMTVAGETAPDLEA
jgi:hypothetical protein